MFLLSDDFLGASSSSQLNTTPPSESSSTPLPGSLIAPTEATLLSPLLSPNEERDTTLSVSSDSISLPTQVEVQPPPAAMELAKKLTEATLEGVVHKKRDEQSPREKDFPHEDKVEPVKQPGATSKGASMQNPASKQPGNAKEEGPQDLRTFELNSDSGKSTPSNNGKKGSF